MLLADAIAIAEARTYLAALADTATTLDGSLAYELTLLSLDTAYADDVPALDNTFHPPDTAALHAIAAAAISTLASHGLDPLQVELLHAMLDDARTQDRQPPDKQNPDHPQGES
ncbi:hypothetical protein [Nocardioides sambongensis]|uniref:hypothetical protein n=1 Tax=Nocardioides sambongensis TaxID=2589074 RepID=UPI00112AD9AE|nr:hypothetical protein [Nocardioides sambongensis]